MPKIEFTRTNPIKIILLSVVVLCLSVSYWPVFQKIVLRWQEGDNSYCYLIVPLFAYLLWDRRHASHAGNRLEVGGKRFAEDLKPQAAEGDLPQTSDLKPQSTGDFRFGEF